LTAPPSHFTSHLTRLDWTVVARGAQAFEIRRIVEWIVVADVRANMVDGIGCCDRATQPYDTPRRAGPCAAAPGEGCANAEPCAIAAMIGRRADVRTPPKSARQAGGRSEASRTCVAPFQFVAETLYSAKHAHHPANGLSLFIFEILRTKAHTGPSPCHTLSFTGPPPSLPSKRIAWDGRR
jgi:hypothetical protein